MSAKKIGQDTFYNLVGLVVPIILFIVSVPLYIKFLGQDRYGIIGIVWLIVGLFGMLDLGLGRAVTRRIAILIIHDRSAARKVLDIALMTNVLIGTIGALLVMGAGWYAFVHVLVLSPQLRQESLEALPLMAIGLPIVTTIGLLSGALQGSERFFTSNRIMVTNSILFQLAPLIGAYLLGPRLWPLVFIALLARVLCLHLFWRECRLLFGPATIEWDRHESIAMLRYGGWITLSAVTGIVISMTDRLIVGRLHGSAAIPSYTIPYDATSRLTILSEALSRTIFPKYAALDAAEGEKLTRSLVRLLAALMVPAVCMVILLAPVIMKLWLGNELAVVTAGLMQIFAIAAFLNQFSRLPAGQLQGQGKVATTGAIAISQALPYVFMQYFLISRYGLYGGAWGLVGRNLLDFFALFLAARSSRTSIVLPLAGGALLVAFLLFSQTWPPANVTDLIQRSFIVGGAGMVWFLLVIPRQMLTSLRIGAFSRRS